MKVSQRAGAKWKDALLVLLASWGMAIVGIALFIQAYSLSAFILLAAYALGHQIVAIIAPPIMVLRRGTSINRALLIALLLNLIFIMIAANFEHHP